MIFPVFVSRPRLARICVSATLALAPVFAFGGCSGGSTVGNKPQFAISTTNQNTLILTQSADCNLGDFPQITSRLLVDDDPPSRIMIWLRGTRQGTNPNQPLSPRFEVTRTSTPTKIGAKIPYSQNGRWSYAFRTEDGRSLDNLFVFDGGEIELIALSKTGATYVFRKARFSAIGEPNPARGSFTLDGIVSGPFSTSLDDAF